jgi:hypothetical protein
MVRQIVSAWVTRPSDSLIAAPRHSEEPEHLHDYEVETQGWRRAERSIGDEG